MTKESKNKAKANESTEVELYLEDNVFYLLVKSLADESKELDSIPVGKEEGLANEMFQLAISIGIMSGAELLHTIMRSKALTKIYDLPGVSVVDISELAK